MSPAQRPDWWKQSVVYQIYPRSFNDSNGDGIGDLPGITQRLDHLVALGVDVVWLSPVYASPQDDNGYDIADYRDIAPEFGTLADFDALLAAMHARGLRLVMDLVVNHSSDEHAWFQSARTSRDSPFHDYYIWAEPAADGGPPTNWEAAFNGSVWEWNAPTGEYYLHMFSKKQPDLNWENPALRQEVYALMRFWLDRGVDGFRMDVINMISKPWRADGSLPDAPVVRDGFLQPGFALSCNGPRLTEFLREMRAQVLDHYDTITVGEAPLATIEQGVALTHPADGALNMLFQFEHMDLDSEGGHINGKWTLKALDLRDLKTTMARWQTALAGRGWNSLYLSNHDQPRPVSRFGDDTRYPVESAKMLATWLHGHQGTPYIYQGEELGMDNVAFDDIADYRDIETLNIHRVATQERGVAPADILRAIHAKGRDNARTPIPWTAPSPDNPGAGFTTGTPWIRLNPSAERINAQALCADPGSVFHYYRELIALRRAHPILVDGRFDLRLAQDAHIYAYTRTLGALTWLVLCHFGAGDPAGAAHPVVTAQDGSGDAVWSAWVDQGVSGRRIIGNWPGAERVALKGLALRPWEALILALEV